jgi:hypothetical protein
VSIDIEPIEAFLHWRNLQSMNDKDLSPQAYARWLYDQENEEKLAQLRALDLSGLLTKDDNYSDDYIQRLEDGITQVLKIIGGV